jgi:Sulfatase
MTSLPDDTATPRRWRRPALYPAALACLVIVEVFVTSGISPFEAVRTLVVAAVVGLLLSGVGAAVLQNRDRGGVLAVLLLFAILGGADLRLVALVAAATVLMVVERYAPTTLHIRWPFVGTVASRITAVLALAVVIQAVQVGVPEILLRAATMEAPFRPITAAAAATTSTSRPDIYVILADAHARADVLSDYFGYDESPFIDGLKERGFSVPTHSRTNYAVTTQVLTSMFNMEPLQDIPSLATVLTRTSTRPPEALMREALDDSPVLARLRAQGYELTATASSFAGPTIRTVDRWIDTGQLNEFEVTFLRRTILRPLLNAFAPDLVSSQYRQRTPDTLAAVADLAAQPSDRPRFVFLHVPSPHPPWVVNADGSPRTIPDVDTIFAETTPSTGLDIEPLKQGYVGQVQWLDKELLTTIDRIDAVSKTPPVIVVFGDHGAWVGADGGDIRRRFRMLFAARVPDGASVFPDDLSLVDAFPILLDHLFGGTTPRHPDAPSWMFRVPEEYDLYPIGDPNSTEPQP